MDRIVQIDWAKDYIQYLDLRKKGLKKQANKALQNFITVFQSQDKKSRRHFIDVVHSIAFLEKEYSIYLPYNLSEDILKKEIYSWFEEEPENSIPYKWSYELDLVKKSLELNSLDQEALLLFGEMLINKVSMNQHEITSGFSYDGERATDLGLLQFYKPLLKNIKDEDKKQQFTRLIGELESCALKAGGS